MSTTTDTVEFGMESGKKMMEWAIQWISNFFA